MSTFRTTRWSLVQEAARDDAAGRRAIEELCRIYRPAALALFRHYGYDPETAEDLAQGLFARLLERGDLAQPDPSRGRFRTYLRACARHHASNHERDRRADKRGGDAVIAPLDDVIAPTDHVTPGRAFDRQFARTLLATVLDRIGAEYERRDRGALFDALRPYLEVGGGPAMAVTATHLGLRESAVKVAVYRLRTRFREELVTEVRQTLLDPDDDRDEIDQLLAALEESKDRP